MIEISYCVVNTAKRELLTQCLDAIARERALLPSSSEVLVLDNASDDGSAAVARAHPTVDEVITLKLRTGKAENDSTLLKRARGRYCLLLNEDAILKPGATAALHAALSADPDAGAAGARLLRPEGRIQPSAWRFPSVTTALIGALFLHRRWVVQSRGTVTRRVDWAQSSALLVRRTAAQQVDWLDPDFFVYSDETDFCRRLADAGWHTLWVPTATVVHYEQLSTDAAATPRIIEFSRNRDRYLRKHHGALTAYSVRLLTAWTYLVRTAGALLLPGHDPRRYLQHVTATLNPRRGEGLREKAAAYNRDLKR